MWKLVAAIYVFGFLVTSKEVSAQIQTTPSGCTSFSCFTNPSCPCIDKTTGLSWTILIPIIVSVVFFFISALICCCCCYFRRRKSTRIVPTENIRIIRDYDPGVIVAPTIAPTIEPPVYSIAPRYLPPQYLRPASLYSPQMMGGYSSYGGGWPSRYPYMSRPMIGGAPGGCQTCTL